MKLTQIIVLSIIAIVIVYDIIIYNVKGVDATVSRVVLGWASNLPIMALAVGVLIGHLFWPQRPKPKDEEDEEDETEEGSDHTDSNS